jgi:hypothetical protein
MSYNIGPITLTPGVASNNLLQNSSAIQAVKLTNGSQFDLQFTGFGTSGASVCPAGLEYMLRATDGNDGYLNLFPIDSLNVGGQGVANLVVYFQQDKLPTGTWPATVPAQRVIASSFAGQVIATNLVNVGNSLTQNVIQISPAGDSGNTFSVDNAGNVTIGDALHGGGLSIVGNLIVGGNVAGNGTSNLKLDSNGTSRAIQFSVNNVQKGFYDNTGLNINTPINNAMGSPNAAPTMTAGLCLSGGLNMYDAAVSGSPHQPSLSLQTDVSSGAGQNVGIYTNNVARMAAFDSGVQFYFPTTFNALLNIVSGGDTQVLAAGAQSASGSVSGTIASYEIFRGTLKIIQILCNSYRNANPVTFTLPVAFTAFAKVVNMGACPMQFIKIGVAQNIFILTALVAAQGTGVTQTTINANSIGVCQSSFDGISFPSTGGQVYSGVITIEGL